MTDNSTAGGFNRLACVIFPSSVGSTSLPTEKSCITGKVDLKHLRSHLRTFHACHCALPCQNAAHRPATEIEFIIDVNKNEFDTVADIWIEMFKRAHPDHENIPAPYLPCSGQLLAITQNPTVEFMNALGCAFANNQTVGIDIPAHENVHTFFRQYDIFYDVVSRTGPLPGAQTELQAVPTIHQPRSVLSPGHQEELQLSTPTRDSSISGVATPVTQPDSVQNPGATVGMSDCTCDDKHMCMQCFETECDGYWTS